MSYSLEKDKARAEYLKRRAHGSVVEGERHRHKWSAYHHFLQARYEDGSLVWKEERDDEKKDVG